MKNTTKKPAPVARAGETPRVAKLRERFLNLVRLAHEVKLATHEPHAEDPIESEACRVGLEYARAALGYEN